MPKCHRCNKIVGKERLVNVFVKEPVEGDPDKYIRVPKHFYQCFRCTYPKNGVWTKSIEDISGVVGKFLSEVNKLQIPESTKKMVEINCLKIQRIPHGLYYSKMDPLEEMNKQFEILLDIIQLD